MKAYLIITGAVFGLVTVAHIFRIAWENQRLASDPVYIALTVASAALCLWAGYLLRRAKT